MFRVVRYIVVAFLVAWTVWNLVTRERRQRLDKGFRRAAMVISLAFVTVGAVMLSRAVVRAGGGAGEALVMIAVGLGLIAYQKWGQ